ncbi:MAG: thioredoxin [Elusimicrobiota bacterium]
MEIKLTDENFKKEILESELTALVDFWAPWCGPCNMVAPIIEEIAKEYQGKLKVGKLNVDEAPETASAYSVMAIPTLMIFKNGKVVENIVGITPKKNIEEKIKPYI